MNISGSIILNNTLKNSHCRGYLVILCMPNKINFLSCTSLHLTWKGNQVSPSDSQVIVLKIYVQGLGPTCPLQSELFFTSSLLG